MTAESFEICGDNKVLYEFTWISLRSDEVENILERRI